MMKVWRLFLIKNSTEFQLAPILKLNLKVKEFNLPSISNTNIPQSQINKTNKIKEKLLKYNLQLTLYLKLQFKMKFQDLKIQISIKTIKIPF